MVKLGTSKMMEGAITAIAAKFPQLTTPEMSVVVEDRLRNLRMNRRTRTFNDVSDSDVFTQIPIEYGLMPTLTRLCGHTEKSGSFFHQKVCYGKTAKEIRARIQA